jgi:RNA polymerase sigma factor (sigma-70 family)
MEDSIYDEGMSISRNFENRKEKETEKLYDIIKSSIYYVQFGTTQQREKAVSFLTSIFEPYIRKISSKIYNNLRNSHEYGDILQETYTMFLTLLKRYNPAIASFSYYIGSMLPIHMSRWAEKEMNNNSLNIPVDIKDYTMVDPLYANSDSVDSYFNSYVLTQEYKVFITHRSERHARSRTVKEVCNKYFLGHNTCSEIAKDLGVSYHAVYEIIGKIKKELKSFFQASAFSEYYISSTGRVVEKAYCRNK